MATFWFFFPWLRDPRARGDSSTQDCCAATTLAWGFRPFITWQKSLLQFPGPLESSSALDRSPPSRCHEVNSSHGCSPLSSLDSVESFSSSFTCPLGERMCEGEDFWRSPLKKLLIHTMFLACFFSCFLRSLYALPAFTASSRGVLRIFRETHADQRGENPPARPFLLPSPSSPSPGGGGIAEGDLLLRW
ncbi:hypothetical protein GWK47_019746 [Chionoecetes opilio]|uniref:Transmembrane protein n=1 Tax=Chionoecetes opilio TaxID=41210 RepID=A0A8J4XU87_CHIOP|nr:hypothetical protein GWK47_019746 [Chionoecetes opilio]